MELKPIAESKVRQLGGDVCGVLVRNEAGAWAAVSEGGRVMWLDDFEGQPSSAQGGRGADAVKWSDPAVDPIVSKLYRKFKEWNRQGFGADDVTWCEVRGYVAELLNAQPQPAVPEGWKLVPVEATGDMEEAGCQGYMEADGNWHMHRSSMGFAYKAMLEAAPAPTTPQADGWVRCEDRLPEPRRQSRKTPNGILAKHESGRITQFREVTKTLVKYMRNGPRKPTKFEQPVGERITEWMDLDAERAGGEK